MEVIFCHLLLIILENYTISMKQIFIQWLILSATPYSFHNQYESPQIQKKNCLKSCNQQNQITNKLMQQQKDQKQQKQGSKLKQIRYRKLNLSNGNTIITYNSLHKVQAKGVLIQFPLIDNNNHEESQYNPPVLDLKQYEDQIYKKSNFRAVKALMKTYQENRRRNSQDCMNMVGLDIKKINYLPPAKSKDKLSKKSTNKLTKFLPRNLSPQSRNMSSRSQKTRKISQQSDTIGKQTSEQSTKILKLELTQSAFLYRKKVSSISKSPSPTKSKIKEGEKQKPKPKYLYEKLAGSENNVREQTNYIYDKRIKSYTDFLFKLQYAHNFYINLDLKMEDLNNRSRRIKCYVGPGNNSAMIKGLLKRRYWWVITQDRSEASFVWTQIKINSIFQKQKRSLKAQTHYRFEKQQQQQQQKQMRKTKLSKDLMSQKIKKQLNQAFNPKILNEDDIQSYKKYINKYESTKERTYAYKYQKVDKILKVIQQQDNLIHNHLQNNFYLGNKKALFYNLREYYTLIGQDVFQYLPLTFHIKKGLKDPQYKRFLAYYNRRSIQIKKEQKRQEEEGVEEKKKTRNIWIVKPGENSNQGRGITVIDQIYQLNSIIKRVGQKKPALNQKKSPQKQVQSLNKSDSSPANNKVAEDQSDVHTYIVQMYIDRPLLYNNRKFDIRHYMLITNFYGVTRAYWYAEGYIRTSSYQFNIGNFQPQIHLTNDAVQKKFPEYGKYEPYNKVSYEQFQRYLDSTYPNKKYDFKKQILPKMKKMGTDAARSVYTKISPKNQMNNFQIFGLDFMIDKNFRPWLIQINTNPCLDCVCPLLDRIIPYMVQQSFKLSLDIAYPPPSHYPNTCKHFAPMINLQQFKYELIFDSQTQGEMLRNIYRKVKGNLIAEIGEIEEDEQFKDDGKEIKLDDFS